MSFALSPAAGQDLRDLYDYLAQDSLEAVATLLDELEQAMNQLAQMPGLGHEHPDLADELLQVWIVRSYLIIYRPNTQPVQIVRVVSGYRDIASLGL